MARPPLTQLLALTASLCATAAVAMAGGVGGIGVASAASCANANLTPQPDNVAQVRAAVLCLIDQEREHHGESPLQPNVKLARAAQSHSVDMSTQDYFSHISPDGETPLQRMRASGYLSSSQAGYAVGENIAWGTLWLATPQAIVKAWMESPGHRANILDASYRETGVGVSPRPPASLAEGQAGAIYTQDFGAILTTGHSSSNHTSDSVKGHSGPAKGRSGPAEGRTGPGGQPRHSHSARHRRPRHRKHHRRRRRHRKHHRHPHHARHRHKRRSHPRNRRTEPRR